MSNYIIFTDSSSDIKSNILADWGVKYVSLTFRFSDAETEYKNGSFGYTNATNYGYAELERYEFYGKREFTADEYVGFCGTHCDHIVIPEPYKSKFFGGLRQAVADAGNKIVFNDTYILLLAQINSPSAGVLMYTLLFWTKNLGTIKST